MDSLGLWRANAIGHDGREMGWVVGEVVTDAAHERIRFAWPSVPRAPIEIVRARVTYPDGHTVERPVETTWVHTCDTLCLFVDREGPREIAATRYAEARTAR